MSHTESDLNKLVQLIKSLSGETKVVMEYTGAYYEPIANALHNQGIFVSVVNPLLIDDYGTNRVRKVKTDKKDSLKIASFAIDKWLDLREYIPANDIRKTLKILNRQYVQYNKILVMQKNNLQDIFLTKVRKQSLPVTVFLMNGFQLRGSVTGFDSFTVVLDTDGKQQVIYKHAISTIIPVHPVPLNDPGLPSEAQ